MLTEPFRGKMHSVKKNSDETYHHESGDASYVPKSHIQYLEQSGIVVVPLNYLLSETELKDELSKVNGVYICGDSENSIRNDKY